MRRISLFASAVALCLSFPAASAEELKPAADPASISAARDLMEVMGVSKQMEGMIDAMSKGFAKGAKADTSDTGKAQAAEFDSIMKKFMGYKDDMLTDFAVLYADTFTVAEMKEVADFYRSGVGAKFISATPALMQKGAQIGMKYSEKMMKEMSDTDKK